MRRAALAGIVASALAIAAAYGSAFLPGPPPDWAAKLFALGVATLLVAVMSLGAAHPVRGLGRLVVPFALIWLLLIAGFGIALFLPDTTGPASPLWFGLPRRAATILYGVGLIPVLVLPLAYAFTFDSLTLTEADVERIRAVRRGRSAGEAD